jgi:hypothetical protein
MMDDSTRVIPRLRRAPPRTARTAAAIIATAVLALLAAACGGSAGSHAAQHGSTGALALSRCMRSHGVLKYPDPTSSGQIPKPLAAAAAQEVSSSQLQVAARACQHLMPNGGSGMTAAQVQQMKAQALRFSRCIRAHGFPNYPDPGSDGREPDPASVGINDATPKFQAALKACPPT